MKPLLPLERTSSHDQWLHELRNVVSTACVATNMGRRLAQADPHLAAELLCEAEVALMACRELLAIAGEHVRVDAPVADMQAPGFATGLERRRTVGEEIDRNEQRRRALRMRPTGDLLAPSGAGERRGLDGARTGTDG